MAATTTNFFSLGTPELIDGKWNGTSLLHHNHHPTSTVIPGRILKAQYAADDYYLLVTEHDTAEETVSLLLLDASLNILTHRIYPKLSGLEIGDPSVCFKKIVWQTDDCFDLYVNRNSQPEDRGYRYRIAPPSFFFRKPRLKLTSIIS